MKMPQMSVLLRMTLILVVLVDTSSSDGVPMVENSVRFALDRCKQFLKLATYLRETALEENSDIRKTKKICDHIVKIDTEFFHDKDESRESDSDEDSSEGEESLGRSGIY